MKEAASDDGINSQSFIIKTNENQEGKTSAECLNDFLKGRNTYIICTRARGGECQGDCDNKSKDRIYNSGTCSSYSRTCKAQPKDSARKRHSARQHQAGQATRCKRSASTCKFMRKMRSMRSMRMKLENHRSFLAISLRLYYFCRHGCRRTRIHSPTTLTDRMPRFTF